MKFRSLTACPSHIVGRAVHVWPVRVGASSTTAQRFAPFLQAAESQRAAQFRFDHLRDSFIIARGMLRVLLGQYLHLPPVAIELQYSSYGKPSLAETRLTFNLSHSGDCALFAFATGCEIGVDVEQIRPMADLQSIADRFFCPEESAELKSLAADRREQAFYLGWTRKEAYIKAVGQGLSARLDDFQVSLESGEPGKPIPLVHRRSVAPTFTIHDLDVFPNSAGALAYSGAERPVVTAPLMTCADLLNLICDGYQQP